MKKRILVPLFSLILSITFGPDSKAQVAKEGVLATTHGYSGAFKAMAMGEERVQVDYEVIGVVITDTTEDLLHNATFRCIGSLQAIRSIFEDDSGFCVYTRPEGDQAFVIYKAAGYLQGVAKGAFTFVGGTGRLTGLEGGGDFSRISGMRPTAEGSFQGYHQIKGHWKLP